MSEWNEADKDCLSLSEDGTEIHVLFKSNYDGNVYVSVRTMDVVQLLYDKIVGRIK